MPIPFPEAVAEEKKTWVPLADDVPLSRKLRRRLFQGETLNPEHGMALGGTSGLVGAVVKLMTEWGFQFERTSNGDNGKIQFKLSNPQHVPTAHIRPERKPREPKGEGSEGRAVRSHSRLHREIREKLIAGEELTIGETMAMGASSAFLRKEVARMKEEGYHFSDHGRGTQRTVKVTKVPGEKRPRATKASKSLASQPAAEVSMANGRSAEDMLFPELSTPPPALGGHLRVIGMMLDETDDTVTLAIKNETGLWKARVEAYVEADD